MKKGRKDDFLRNASIFVVFGVLMSAPAAYGQALNAGEVSREIEKTLPTVGKGTAGVSRGAVGVAPAETRQGKKAKRYIEDPTKELPEEETLGAPIAQIVLSTRILKKEIFAILQDRTFNQSKIGTRDLDHVRQEIWDMGIKNKRLLHVKFRVVPEPKDSKSWLIVEVVEIAVRHVSVVSEGSVRQAVLDSIQKEATRDFYEEKILDLNELDDKITSRLRLGDVLLHSSVVPVDETHVDLKITVGSMPAVSPSILSQYDNGGGWSFGRDRLIGGASLQGLGFSGDRLDLMTMKSMDIGNMDIGGGTYFGRAEYQVPVGEWGLRLDTWASGLHYYEVKAVPSNTQSNGEAIEMGQGVIRPLYTSKSTIVDARADYYFKYTVDRTLETTRIAEKNEHNLRLQSMISHALWDRQMIQLTLGLTEGKIDLSGDTSSLAQDQAGPKVNGMFTKLEEDVTWFGRFGGSNRVDYKVRMKGQWAPNNLDAIEQFSLGGPTGLRAFGSGEGSGDSGFIINGDVGYAVGYGLRPFALYDVGKIWKSAKPWQGEGGVPSYVLQDIGVGVTESFEPLDVSLTFAHQVGRNPALSAGGLDIDNSKQHYRVWSSVVYRY